MTDGLFGFSPPPSPQGSPSLSSLIPLTEGIILAFGYVHFCFPPLCVIPGEVGSSSLREVLDRAGAPSL
ncbi:hypothetical protein OYC64_019714 [Pagothenia borchgrevinki]|uniref:Uncharacterized protein n=1 Tax=Pagothenia borchgrevinki TaxID=8213 RepID=A0ABD2FIM8_PAGBO